MKWIALAALLALAACISHRDPGPWPRLQDLDGRWHQPSAPAAARATVIVFVATDCPIANSYAPEVRAIVRQHAEAPLRFYLVHADRTLDAATARRHAEAYHLPAPILLDRDRSLAHALGARVTPEAFVLDEHGAVAYRGRIDDAWADLGVRRTVTTTHELRDAIAALLEGKPPTTPRTEPIGCVLE